MKHFGYRERGEDLHLDADYVVVGSGAGGATAAVSLAREGASVVLIEAGAWRAPGDYPTTTYGSMRDMMSDMGSILTTGRALWPIVQGRAVGGTTVINSAICVRTPGDIFEQWEREHGVAANPLSDKLWGYQDELEVELGAEDSPAETLGRNNELAIKAAAAMGIDSHVTKRYVKGCEGSGMCINGCRTSRKQSLNITFVPEMLRLGGTLLSCAPANRIITDGMKATGVRGHFSHPMTRKKGAKYEIRAKKAVIVAAGVVRTPILLQQSKIRSKAIGKFFRAHPGTGIFGYYDDPVDMHRANTQGWASSAYRNEPGFKLETLVIPPGMITSRLGAGGASLTEQLETYRHLAMWVMAVRAESVGTVHSVFGMPMVRYTMNPTDMNKLRVAAHLLAKMHFAAGARYVMPCIYGVPDKIGPDQVDMILQAPLDPRAWFAAVTHLFGGATMGSDPSRSVCDGRGNVHGYTGLVIADASQIPTNLGVNPQHTIMALARLRAHQLLQA